MLSLAHTKWAPPQVSCLWNSSEGFFLCVQHSDLFSPASSLSSTQGKLTPAVSFQVTLMSAKQYLNVFLPKTWFIQWVTRGPFLKSCLSKALYNLRGCRNDGEFRPMLMVTIAISRRAVRENISLWSLQLRARWKTNQCNDHIKWLHKGCVLNTPLKSLWCTQWVLWGISFPQHIYVKFMSPLF